MMSLGWNLIFFCGIVVVVVVLRTLRIEALSDNTTQPCRQWKYQYNRVAQFFVPLGDLSIATAVTDAEKKVQTQEAIDKGSDHAEGKGKESKRLTRRMVSNGPVGSRSSFRHQPDIQQQR